MKKKKTKTKKSVTPAKLPLSTETIRTLEADQLPLAAGGYATGSRCDMGATC